MVKFRVVIPARYQSSRFLGKALAEIAGKPMVQHVYERALKSGATSAIIATDDERIINAAKSFGAPACMTSMLHQSGSDRLAEAIDVLGYSDDDIVVNLQGDEPMMPPEIIAQVANDLSAHESASVATVCEPLTTVAKLLDPNLAKVVRDSDGYALYFSRSPIPYDRSSFPLNDEGQSLAKDIYYRHIGIYAARARFWREYVKWEPCQLEILESLEQLRILWHSKKIFVGVSNHPSFMEVNTPEDLARVQASLQ